MVFGPEKVFHLMVSGPESLFLSGKVFTATTTNTTRATTIATAATAATTTKTTPTVL